MRNLQMLVVQPEGRLRRALSESRSHGVATVERREAIQKSQSTFARVKKERMATYSTSIAEFYHYSWSL
jgi:hypothetical protein